MASAEETESCLSGSSDDYSVMKNKLKKILPTLVQDLTCIPDIGRMMSERMKRCIHYHTDTKKLSRGIIVATAYKDFEKDAITPENEYLSYVLAWCLELVEIAFEIVDDMLDGSEARRGRKSWHVLENSAPLACNDAWAIECCAYALLKKYFDKLPYYVELLELFKDVTMKTLQGQAVDVLTAAAKNSKMLTMDQYMQITKYRSSYLACYFPIKLSLLMSGIGVEHWEQIKDICIELGFMYAIQDDFMDVFGEFEEIGTDIAMGKCFWPTVASLEVASEHHRKILLENHGSNDPRKVLICKDLFISLGIPKIYKIQERERMEKVNSMISCLPLQNIRTPLYKIMKIICTNKF